MIPSRVVPFEFGLTATWIRNTFLRVLREAHPAVARKLSATFIYDHPTISGLADYISASMSGASIAFVGSAEDKRRELQALVSKYTESFPEFKPAPAGQLNETVGDVVPLTGSTVSLGSSILAKLIQRAGTARVYASSRPSPDRASAKDRHVVAFAREGLDVDSLDSSKVRFLVGDPSYADFAVEPTVFKEMQSSVTHNSQCLASELQCYRDFVRIEHTEYYKESKVAEEKPLAHSDSALSTGYAESKWVSEQILEKASKKTLIEYEDP
ncbi:hypothetical protein EW145_g2472 [Phellinidium pouzarii]|uniref:Thioester reductase (TE) domain-containing protein n=1 Tax=Phellinidium pouzarii TaxID=167371 RepID=A0A4S4LAQ5_9AGAM|nr:hypothetical protein EW145_g2472 [Phellinidium pouzarii]